MSELVATGRFAMGSVAVCIVLVGMRYCFDLVEFVVVEVVATFVAL
jgi:hypothetical protein